MPCRFPMSESFNHLSNTTRMSTGMDRLNDFRRHLSNMDIAFSPQQEQLVDAIESAFVPTFFGKEIGSYADKIMRDNNWSTLNTNVLGMMGRRCGKTAVVTACIAAYLLAMPNASVCILTIQKDLAFQIMSQVCIAIWKLGYGDKIVALNAHELRIQGSTSKTDFRSLTIVASDDVNVSKKKFFYFYFFNKKKSCIVPLLFFLLHPPPSLPLYLYQTISFGRSYICDGYTRCS